MINLFFVLILFSYSLVGHSCPLLEGKYSDCEGVGHKIIPIPSTIEISQTKENGIITYIKKNNESELNSQKFIVNGLDIDLPSKFPKLVKDSIKIYCINKSLVSIRKKSFLKTGKKQVEKVVMAKKNDSSLSISLEISNDRTKNSQQITCY